MQCDNAVVDVVGNCTRVKKLFINLTCAGHQERLVLIK